jgi:hypothetical protein
MPAHISGGYARPFLPPSRRSPSPKNPFIPAASIPRAPYWHGCVFARLHSYRGATCACVHGLNSPSSRGVTRRSARSPRRAAPNDPTKKKGRAGEHSAQVFGRPGDCRGHFGASPQAALASRRGEGGGEGALASLHRRPISSCAAGLWIQPRPCKQSGSNLSSKATARQLANLPERASSRARACTRCKVSLKSRLSRVMRGSLARARGLPRAP